MSQYPFPYLVTEDRGPAGRAPETIGDPARRASIASTHSFAASDRSDNALSRNVSTESLFGGTQSPYGTMLPPPQPVRRVRPQPSIATMSDSAASEPYSQYSNPSSPELKRRPRTGLPSTGASIGETDDEGNGVRTVKRRTRLACTNCRKRKIKCSGDCGNGEPCDSCKSSPESCQFLRAGSQSIEFSLPALAPAPRASSDSLRSGYEVSFGPSLQGSATQPVANREQQGVMPFAYGSHPANAGHARPPLSLVSADGSVRPWEDQASTHLYDWSRPGNNFMFRGVPPDQ